MKIEQYQQVWSLWTNYEKALKKYVFKFTQNEEIAKDIVQDVLLKVYQSCCSNTAIRNVRAWLFQITYNTMMDFFKKSQKAFIISNHPIEDSQQDIYQALSIYIEPLISFLPEKYAVALRLADIEGLKQQTIADQLNLSLAATKSRIQRARKLLKEEIHTCFQIETCANTPLADFQLKQSCTSLKNWEKKKAEYFLRLF
ncbi:MAG: sigma-70 family RNA polymerase sigma factor [Thermonemataceae bacterium]